MGEINCHCEMESSNRNSRILEQIENNRTHRMKSGRNKVKSIIFPRFQSRVPQLSKHRSCNSNTQTEISRKDIQQPEVQFCRLFLRQQQTEKIIEIQIEGQTVTVGSTSRKHNTSIEALSEFDQFCFEAKFCPQQQKIQVKDSGEGLGVFKQFKSQIFLPFSEIKCSQILIEIQVGSFIIISPQFCDFLTLKQNTCPISLNCKLISSSKPQKLQSKSFKSLPSLYESTSRKISTEFRIKKYDRKNIENIVTIEINDSEISIKSIHSSNILYKYLSSFQSLEIGDRLRCGHSMYTVENIQNYIHSSRLIKKY